MRQRKEMKVVSNPQSFITGFFMSPSSSNSFIWIGYIPVAADKSHGRIIWDCAWSQEGDIFATASRDKTVCPVLCLCICARCGSSHHVICRSKSGERFKTPGRQVRPSKHLSLPRLWHFQTSSTRSGASFLCFVDKRACVNLKMYHRKLAIGLESGEILIYIGPLSNSKEWLHFETIPSK